MIQLSEASFLIMKTFSITTLALLGLSALTAATPVKPGPGGPGGPPADGKGGPGGKGGGPGYYNNNNNYYNGMGGGPYNCLSQSDASNLVNAFGGLLTNYSTAATQALLTPDFVDVSDSINYLAGIPLGSVTFPNRAAFEASQGAQPPIGFQVLAIDAVTCDTIAFRWNASVAARRLPVQGINILNAVKSDNTGNWMISKVFSEFNSAAWIVNYGASCSLGP